MTINLIYAKSLNNVIGNKGKLPWHVPDDLKEFKQRTGTNTVVMGRKTYDSLPMNVKPLPNRKNIIISSVTNSWKSLHPDCTLVSNPIEYFKNLSKSETIWVMGGSSIYNLALPFADHIFETTIKLNVEGETLAPKIDMGIFKVFQLSETKIDTSTNIEFFTTHYKRQIE